MLNAPAQRFVSTVAAWTLVAWNVVVSMPSAVPAIIMHSVVVQLVTRVIHASNVTPRRWHSPRYQEQSAVATTIVHGTRTV